jgi:phospholipid/cholesterol/gamma-HCH transport system permease protein
MSSSGNSISVNDPTRQRGSYVVGGRTADRLTVRLTGAWRLADRLPTPETIEQAFVADPAVRELVLDGSTISAWDTGLVAFVTNVLADAGRRGIAVDVEALPAGVRRLIRLATAVPEEHLDHPQRAAWLGRVGLDALAVGEAALAFLRFLGDCSIALTRFAAARARFLWSDVAQVIQDCGPNALPIVTLISFLVGLILAFMGAVQLRTFGAQIYVADLVAIATTREMGCLMTAIIMAGRTGAAFAAQLGTMQVNEEIDALTTMGIRPLEFLVLPRMLALVAMMPLLTVYSDVLAIVGGAVVGVTVLDLNATQYLERTLQALTLTHFVIGIVKGTVFGMLVAFSGCLRGMRAGRSAADVGLATTSAVVTAIVLIVVTEGLFAVVLNALGL